MKIIAGIIAAVLCAVCARAAETTGTQASDAAIKARFAAVATKLNALDAQWRGSGGKTGVIAPPHVVEKSSSSNSYTSSGRYYTSGNSSHASYSGRAAGGTIEIGGMSGSTGYGSSSGPYHVHEGSASGS